MGADDNHTNHVEHNGTSPQWTDFCGVACRRIEALLQAITCWIQVLDEGDTPFDRLHHRDQVSSEFHDRRLSRASLRPESEAARVHFCVSVGGVRCNFVRRCNFAARKAFCAARYARQVMTPPRPLRPKGWRALRLTGGAAGTPVFIRIQGTDGAASAPSLPKSWAGSARDLGGDAQTAHRCSAPPSDPDSEVTCNPCFGKRASRESLFRPLFASSDADRTAPCIGS